MKQILIASAILLLSAPCYADKRPDTIVTRDDRKIVRAGVEDAVEYLPQKLPTFGKKTIVIQIEIPVCVEAKWRRYYIANFVQKYAFVLNQKIDSQMQFAVLSETPNEKLADAWEAQEIVVPQEFEDLPDGVAPKASDLFNNASIKSWEYRATALAQTDFKALKAKIGSAE